MLNCPACDHPLDQDFGMTTCGSCQAVLIIDINGQVQIGGDSGEMDQEGFQATDYGDEENGAELSGETEVGIHQDEEDFSSHEDQGVFDHPVEEAFDQEPEEVLEKSSRHMGETPPIFPDETPPAPEPEVPLPDNEPVDITGFANSSQSNLEEGEYLYDLTISGLDSQDLKEALKYILMDHKLKLNYQESLESIKDGRVTISSLSPIKAKRMVEQLQYEDMDVEWVQKSVVMEPLEPVESMEAEDMQDG